MSSRNIAIMLHVLRPDAVAAAAGFIDVVAGREQIACWLRPEAIEAVRPLLTRPVDLHLKGLQALGAGAVENLDGVVEDVKFPLPSGLR